MIQKSTKSNLHWNYFIALEDDLETLSRYIEFCQPNLDVFSIELAHLLFAAASEVDVLAKSICKIAAPSARCKDIDDYRKILSDPANTPVGFDSLCTLPISLPRYGLKFVPWENWSKDVNPDWWRSYNNVKHQRDKHFQEATLQNAMNALGALLILNFYGYRLELRPKLSDTYSRPFVACRLRPESRLLRLPFDYYADPSPAPDWFVK